MRLEGRCERGRFFSGAPAAADDVTAQPLPLAPADRLCAARADPREPSGGTPSADTVPEPLDSYSSCFELLRPPAPGPRGLHEPPAIRPEPARAPRQKPKRGENCITAGCCQLSTQLTPPPPEHTLCRLV